MEIIYSIIILPENGLSLNQSIEFLGLALSYKPKSNLRTSLIEYQSDDLLEKVEKSFT